MPRTDPASKPTVHDCPTCHMRPGSDTARAQGCTCPVLDNGHGHNTGRMVFRLDCSVHGKQSADD